MSFVAMSQGFVYMTWLIKQMSSRLVSCWFRSFSLVLPCGLLLPMPLVHTLIAVSRVGLPSSSCLIGMVKPGKKQYLTIKSRIVSPSGGPISFCKSSSWYSIVGSRPSKNLERLLGRSRS